MKHKLYVLITPLDISPMSLFKPVINLAVGVPEGIDKMTPLDAYYLGAIKGHDFHLSSMLCHEDDVKYYDERAIRVVTVDDTIYDELVSRDLLPKKYVKDEDDEQD